MIIKKEDMKIESREKMREGEGVINIRHLVDKNNLVNARLLAYINIPVNASIGEHEHLNETEYFIILKGKAIVSDNRVEKKLEEGDVIATGHNEVHSIKNISDIPLELIALIIKN